MSKKIIVYSVSATASEKQETAAKTALMLTNAVIGDSQITVKCSGEGPSEEEESPEGDGISQEDKPKAVIFAEILAAGYQLQDTIIEKGIEFDAKFGISTRLSHYLQTIQEQLKKLDDKYHVTETVTNQATAIDAKLGVQDKVKYAATQVQDRANQALDTSPGKQLVEFYLSTQKQVADVHNEARRIANEKKAARIVDASIQEKIECQ
ncbi:2813_t:CDS:2 [Cetraspora pellucida]|uniref:2813_t:CDS:1 n=1 Tax=Cetraspora pellucida TaxID=1433469 RepID=A0A9N9FI92_9GLOM|nr:2813_t:CDS:2 [Cetraspora pellucida]